MKHKIQQEFKKYLDKTTSTDFNTQLLELFTDLISVAENNWDYASIRYSTVMTKKEWENFVNHPERSHYKSKLGFPTAMQELMPIIFNLTTYAVEYYNATKTLKFKEQLKGSIGSLIDCALNAKYDIEDIRNSDIYANRSEEQRDNGEINPTEMSLGKLNYAIKEYCDYHNQDYTKVKTEIYKICDGRISVLSDYFDTCSMPHELRKKLVEIFEILGRDQTFQFANIKLSWNIWKKIRESGIDTEKYLELMDLPKFSTVKRKLLEFQNNEEFISEVLKHFEDELPLSFKKFKKEGKIEHWELMDEEANRKEYPKNLRSNTEIEKMIEESKKEIYGYFPLSKIDNPRNILFNPTHPSSTSRAFQSSVKNSIDQKVNVIVMTPRVQLKTDYLPVLAHETAHALHRIILEMGEVAGILEKGAGDRVPSTVMEDFSQLVEHPFHKDTELPYDKKYKGKEFPNYYSGVVTRAQVAFSLTQLEIRKYFDKLWASGFREELSEEMLWDIRYKFGKKYKEWDTLGINIRSRGLPLRYSALNPNDGLVYMKRYITETKTKWDVKGKTTNSMGMAEAFETKYGKDWINASNARIMLHWLLLESGRNYKTELFYKFIMEKPLDECKEELTLLGIETKEL